MNANQEIIAELRRVLEERDQARRERDLSRQAEERARESLDELDAAIYECLPGDDDDAPIDCVERAGDKLRELARARDEARAEVERLRAEAAPMNEHFNAGYRDGYRDAYRRGAEAMRERCEELVKHNSHEDGIGMGSQRIEGAIRALPIPEEP